MRNILLAVGFLSLSHYAYAGETIRCVVKDGTLVKSIELDVASKSALITDLFDHTFPGKISLAHEHNGSTRFNINFEHIFPAELNLKISKRSMEVIVFPIIGTSYRIGMAGYAEQNGEKYLDVVTNEEAQCELHSKL